MSEPHHPPLAPQIVGRPREKCVEGAFMPKQASSKTAPPNVLLPKASSPCVSPHGGGPECAFSQSHYLKATPKTGHLEQPRMSKGGWNPRFPPLQPSQMGGDQSERGGVAQRQTASRKRGCEVYTPRWYLIAHRALIFQIYRPQNKQIPPNSLQPVPETLAPRNMYLRAEGGFARYFLRTLCACASILHSASFEIPLSTPRN